MRKSVVRKRAQAARAWSGSRGVDVRGGFSPAPVDDEVPLKDEESEEKVEEKGEEGEPKNASNTP